MIRNKFSLTSKAMLVFLSLFLVLGSIPSTAYVYADEDIAVSDEAAVEEAEEVAPAEEAPTTDTADEPVEEAPVTTDEELSAPEEAPVTTDEEFSVPVEAPEPALEAPIEAAEPVVEEVVSETEVISREALGDVAPAEDPAAEAPAEESLTDNVYLDPVNGDDSNIGSESKPVKSFDRAKEILSENESVNTVLVMNTIPGDGEMSLPGGVLKRGPGFLGAMIQVAGGKSLSLNDIVIDGDSTQLAEEPAVKVYGTLDINADTVIRNNKRQNKSGQSSPYKTRGGAIRAHRGGIVNMHDGLIEGNYADLGGGVYADGTFNMFGGEIVSNEAFNGGGAHAGSGGTINFHDGLIKNNRANMEGGGISIGGIDDWGMPCELHMFGGTIDGNKSEKAGGGIFIQANCYAYVGGGNIVNNVGASSRVSYPDNFIGGGIYVNGGYKGIKDGVLELSKVYISGNRARGGGGGIANCPSSTLSAYISNGVAIGGNHETGFMGTSRIPNDFLITSKTVGQHTGNPIMYLASIMLGGGKNNWVHQSSNAAFEPLDEEHQLPNSTTYTLINEISEEDLERGKEKASVIITNNRAATGKGGGIGSNGIVRIGVEYPEYGELKVTKTVDGDETSKSGEFNFTVTLDYKFTGTYGDMEFVDGVSTFTLKDGESKTAKNLIPDVEYAVEEIGADGFVVSYIDGKTGEVSEEAGRGEIVPGETASIEAVNKQVTRVDGIKTWKDDTEEDRPEAITVRLYADGEEVDSIDVTAEDEWKYAFEKLPYFADGKVIEYSVTEDEVEGYTTEINGFEITNTKVPDEPEPEPPTPDEPEPEPPTPDEPEPPSPPTPSTDEPEPPSPPTPSTDEPEPPSPEEPDNPPTVDEPEPPTPETPDNPPTVDEPEPPAPSTPSTGTPETPAKTPDKPKTETTPKTPSTGDAEEPLTWGGVMVLAGGAIAVVLSKRRRKRG